VSGYDWLVDSGMTTAEFVCLQEWLGLTDVWLAKRFGVKEQSVRRWRTGEHRVPDGIAKEMRLLKKFTLEADAEIYQQGLEDGALTVYRNDREYAQAGVFPGMSAAWHRRICGELAVQYGWRLDFPSEDVWETLEFYGEDA